MVNSMTNTTTYLARSAVLLARLVQVTLSLLAVVFVAGAILGNMSAFAFVVIGPVAIFLLLVALVVEFVAVRPVQRRYGGGDGG